jgi:hypothetical protein
MGGHTPLSLALLNHRPEEVRALLLRTHAARAEELVREEAASGAGRAELLGFLGLPAGATPEAIRAEVNAKGKDTIWGMPIHKALQQDKDVGLVWQLLDAGGPEQLRAEDVDGDWLPIHIAAQSSTHVEVVALLLDRGGRGQLSAKTKRGATPLAIAEQNGRPKEIQALFLPPLPAVLRNLGVGTR